MDNDFNIALLFSVIALLVVFLIRYITGIMVRVIVIVAAIGSLGTYIMYMTTLFFLDLSKAVETIINIHMIL